MFATMRQSWLLFALSALMALTTALDLGSLHIDGIEAYIHNGIKRQATATGNIPTPTPTPTPIPTPTPTSTEESSEAPVSTTLPDQDPSSSAPPPEQQSSAALTTDDPVTDPVTTPAPTTTAGSSAEEVSTPITTPVVKSTPLVATSVQEYVTVRTTIVNGLTQVGTITTSRTALITTGTAFTTELPKTQQQDENSGNGLSTEKKTIIGGVVGGIGGALLLGGLALVAWRIWGRKKSVSEDDDDLTFSTGSALGDKSSNVGSANTPFQSNLEQYHNPGRPNAAANF